MSKFIKLTSSYENKPILLNANLIIKFSAHSNPSRPSIQTRITCHAFNQQAIEVVDVDESVDEVMKILGESETTNMKQYFVTYNLSRTNAFDKRQLVLLVRAESDDEALKIVMSKIKDTDRRDWTIKEIEYIDNQPIEALLICDGCARQEWFPDAKKKTVKIAQDQLGWIVKDNKHYCSKECSEKVKKMQEIEVMFVGGSRHGNIKILNERYIGQVVDAVTKPKFEKSFRNFESEVERYKIELYEQKGLVNFELYLAIKEGCSITSIYRQIKNATTKDQAYRLIKRMINNV